MKSFWGALLIFAAMLGAITLNHLYITRACEELTTEIETLPPCEEATDATLALSRQWESQKRLFGLSVSKSTVERATLAITELAYAAKLGDARLFESARIRAICLFEEILNAESLLAENWV